MKYISSALLATASPTLAVATFTESFNSDNALWDSATRGVGATWVSSGGADGGGYITNDLDFSGNAHGDARSVIRAEVNFGPPPSVASGGAFVGDWLADNVSSFSVSVRHNASVPLSYFARFADPVNFPGEFATTFTPILPNTWTEITFAINENNPQFVSFEGQSFSSVFDNIGDIQIGVSVPASLAGLDDTITITFDIDSATVTTVPEPSIALLAVVGLAGLSRRKRN